MRRTATGTTRTLRPSAALVVVAVVVALVALVALVGGTAVPAAAQAEPGTDPASEPVTPTPVPKVRTATEQRAVDAAIRLYKVQADLAGVERTLAGTAERLAGAEQVLAETERKLTEVRAALVEIRSTLQSRAAMVYQNHSDRLGMVLSVDRVVNLAAGKHYADSVAAVDNREVARLQTLVADLDEQRAAQDTVRRGLADEKAALERDQAALQAEVDRERAAIEEVGGVPLMGSSVLSATEIAAWFKSTGQRARLMGTTTIDELAEMYVSEGAAESIRGDLAFAQAVLETGSFGHATDNNFAGIGACDSCDSQYLFPTPRDGVRAQIQLLLNYADPFSRAERLTNPLDATLHGTDPVRGAVIFDTFPFKGRAPVWNVMGAGNWATDPLYAGKVLTIYSRMLQFAAPL